MHSCRASCMTTVAITCCKELPLRAMSLVEVRAHSWQANASPESTTSTHILASCIPNLSTLIWQGHTVADVASACC